MDVIGVEFMNKMAISTAAFCLWDIGPQRKLEICKNFGFEKIVLAFSTLKMLKTFVNIPKLYESLSSFSCVTIHAPWCGVKYKDNSISREIFECLYKIKEQVNIEAVVFSFDSVADFNWLTEQEIDCHIKNPSHASWKDYDLTMKKYGFKGVLDINKATRFENYMDKFLIEHKENIRAVHVSGFIDELGRTPIVESGQVFLLDKIKKVDAPVIIEGLFSPGDFDAIREEIDVIQERLYEVS